jgi:hypothetical protein
VALDVKFAASGERLTETVEVSAATPADVTLTLRSWSALEVKPFLAGEPRAPYAGPLRVTLYRSGTDVATMMSFSGPPYRVVGVEPRAYDVDVGCASGTARVDRVDAAASTVVPVEMTLRPSPAPR